jgi:hypothetical protein
MFACTLSARALVALGNLLGALALKQKLLGQKPQILPKVIETDFCGS